MIRYRTVPYRRGYRIVAYRAVANLICSSGFFARVVLSIPNYWAANLICTSGFFARANHMFDRFRTVFRVHNGIYSDVLRILRPFNFSF